MSILNYIVNELDIALRTLADKKTGTDRKYPPEPIEKNSEELSKKEKDLSIQMMRINHAGEVAAQALYRGQAFVCKDPEIKKHLIHAGEEETDHLVWCKRRLDELGGKSSILNPIWYAGSFAIGAVLAPWEKKLVLVLLKKPKSKLLFTFKNIWIKYLKKIKRQLRFSKPCKLMKIYMQDKQTNLELKN